MRFRVIKIFVTLVQNPSQEVAWPDQDIVGPER